MFTAAVFVIAKNWTHPHVLQQVKEIVVHPYHGILFSNKKEWTWYT